MRALVVLALTLAVAAAVAGAAIARADAAAASAEAQVVAVPPSAVSGGDASRPPVACPRLSETVWIEVGEWGGAGTTLRRERVALVVSQDANRRGGYIVYGSATPTRADTDQFCRPTAVRREPDRRRLSKPFYYRRTSNGNAYFTTRGGDVLPGDFLHRRSYDVVTDRHAHGLTYICPVGRAVTILIADSRDRNGRVVGTYFSVRLGRELLATAVVRKRGESFFRISSRCEQR